MNRLRTMLALLALVTGILYGSSAVASTENPVSIVLQDPMNFTDIESTNQTIKRSAKQFERALLKHFAKNGAEMLQDGHQLQLTFKNVDRAGEVFYNGAISPFVRLDFNQINPGVRVLRDSVLVRLEFDFVLKNASGTELQRNSAELKQFFDANRALNRFVRNDQFYLEKKLLTQWVESLYSE